MSAKNQRNLDYVRASLYLHKLFECMVQLSAWEDRLSLSSVTEVWASVVVCPSLGLHLVGQKSLVGSMSERSASRKAMRRYIKSSFRPLTYDKIRTPSLYLQTCSTALMVLYGETFDPKARKVTIYLSRTELPKCIPLFYRQMIERHDCKADRLLPFYLSAFSLAKLVLLVRTDTRE